MTLRGSLLRSAAETRAARLHAAVALLLAAVSLTAASCDRGGHALVPQSTPLVGTRAELDRVTIGGESRSTLKGRTHRFEVTVPPHGEVDLAFGVRAPNQLERVTFTVAYEQDGQRHALMERRFEPPAEGATEWHDVTVNLDALSGQRVTLILDADIQPIPPLGWPAVWTVPRLRGGAAEPRTNLILISIDTLRADHLGCYGYGRPTSPNVDRMARQGILFHNFIASSCWTLPSHASMLTGLDPARHGAVRFGVRPLSNDLDTLAELLWDLGYETAAFVGGGFVGSNLRFDQGFDRFWESPDGKFGAWRSARRGGRGETDTLQWVVDSAKPWMERRRDGPFFLFLHTFQVHVPYAPPPPYDAMFDPQYRGPYQTQFTRGDARDLRLRIEKRRRDGPFLPFLHTFQVHVPYAPPPPHDAMFDPQYRGPYQTQFTQGDARDLKLENPQDPRIVEHLSALYDGAIRAMDAALGDLLDFLEATGLARNTCVLFTSDHGEEFTEHGDLHHSKAKLYEELIRIPLIAWCPSRFRGGRIARELASHTDIVPTMLELAGGTSPADVDGVSLLPVLEGVGAPDRVLAISEVDGSTERKQGTVRAIRTDQYKLIESSIDGSELLFDLSTDPAERRDLRPSRTDLAQQLRKAADGRHRGPPATPAPAIIPDGQLRERLRALGYIE